MTTPTTCPHCGAAISSYGPELYECGTQPTFNDPLGPVGPSVLAQSNWCRERAAHAATKKEGEDALAMLGVYRLKFEEVKAARKKAEAELGSATDEPNPNGSTHARLNWWKAQCDKANNQLAETRKELAEALGKVVDAAGLLSRLMPYLGHGHPDCVKRCECGLNAIIMEAGKAAGVVTPEAKEGK